MKPVDVAGHAMLGPLHNDLYMIGPLQSTSGPVQLFLRNGYGVSLGRTWYDNDDYPTVAPIKRNPDSAAGFDYAWDAHPAFADVQFSERNCDADRARAILTHMKENHG